MSSLVRHRRCKAPWVHSFVTTAAKRHRIFQKVWKCSVLAFSHSCCWLWNVSADARTVSLTWVLLASMFRNVDSDVYAKKIVSAVVISITLGFVSVVWWFYFIPNYSAQLNDTSYYLWCCLFISLCVYLCYHVHVTLLFDSACFHLDDNLMIV